MRSYSEGVGLKGGDQESGGGGGELRRAKGLRGSLFGRSSDHFIC